MVCGIDVKDDGGDREEDEEEEGLSFMTECGGAWSCCCLSSEDAITRP